MKLVAGVGINDADYPVKPRGGEHCKIHKLWANMINRCYAPSYQERFKSYKGCTVHPDWHRFSMFRQWVLAQNWNRKDDLDKDLLMEGNTEYGPNTCVFIDRKTNLFIGSRESKRERNGGLRGVGITSNGKFIGQIKKADGGSLFSEVFNTEQEAHDWYVKTKSLIAIDIAALQTNPVVSKAILDRYMLSK